MGFSQLLDTDIANLVTSHAEGAVLTLLTTRPTSWRTMSTALNRISWRKVDLRLEEGIERQFVALLIWHLTYARVILFQITGFAKHLKLGFGAVWCEIVLCGVRLCGVVLSGMVGVVWCCVVRCCLVWWVCGLIFFLFEAENIWFQSELQDLQSWFLKGEKHFYLTQTIFSFS